jgi:phosphate transport system permease protein
LSPRHADRLLSIALNLAASAAAGVLLLVVWVMIAGAWPALAGPGLSAFLGDATWQPANSQFGALGMIVGSLLVTVVALIIALPLGGMTALASGWLLPPRWGAALRLVILIIAGLPSVVIGLWGLTALVPVLGHWHAPGVGLLAAGVVLAVMILPTIAIVGDAALRAVPADQRRAAAALGLSRLGGLLAAAGPQVRAGLLTGGVLGVARALGETMAVLLVAGNVVQVPTSIMAPVRTLTGGIALEMAYATGEHRAALFVLGLIALVVVTGLLVVVRMLVPDTARQVAHG